ncbi:MAG: hypothetical protein R2856_08215 [Caldilineaceae bacterium]
MINENRRTRSTICISAFPQVALDVELTTLSTYPLPADDARRCVSSVHLAPAQQGHDPTDTRGASVW